MVLAEPLVSIGLPVHNGELYIRRALDTLLAQDYKNLELIISDNASSDATREICEEVAAKDPRVRYYRNQENIGINANFRRVVRLARGPYFMWAACDDIWHPRFVSALLSGLIANTKHGICMSSFIWILDDGSEHERIIFDGVEDLTNLNFKDVFLRMLKLTPSTQSWRIHTFIYGLFHTELLKALLRRPIPSCMAGDRVMMAELSLATRFCSIKDILYRKTWHKKSLAERYRHEDLGKQWDDPLRWTRYVFTMAWRLLSSRLIPLHRKVTLVLPALIRFTWRYRPYLLAELRHQYQRTIGTAGPAPAVITGGKAPLKKKAATNKVSTPVSAPLIELDAAIKNFDEQYYLEVNPDVVMAIKEGLFSSAAEHFASFGFKEGRRYSAKQPNQSDS